MTFDSRSAGVKLFTVGILALVMTAPALFVDGLVEDRRERAASVAQSIGSASGGPQTFLGPVLAIPYASGTGVHVIFPATGSLDVATKSEVRHRSLFRVPVYAATLKFNASFDVGYTDKPLDWSRAELITGASDSRGALSDVTISSGSTTSSMGMSGLLTRIPLIRPDHPENSVKVFGVKAGETVKPGAQFDVAVNMKFSGSQALTVLPFARASTIRMRGDWANPGFQGGFMPGSQRVGTQGFEAQWSIPFLARGIAPEGGSELLSSLLPIAPSVDFVEVADAYQSVARSVKYALLFLSLVFSAFFVFEITTAKRVHPAQYVLVGVAQVIFYLLLLSIAERIGFGLGFAIASLATVSLISADARWIFKSSAQGLRAFAIFSTVYGLIYLLLTLEDEALLIGSVASFAAVAVMMYFTRAVDWYGGLAKPLSQHTDPGR